MLKKPGTYVSRSYFINKILQHPDLILCFFTECFFVSWLHMYKLWKGKFWLWATFSILCSVFSRQIAARCEEKSVELLSSSFREVLSDVKPINWLLILSTLTYLLFMEGRDGGGKRGGVGVTTDGMWYPLNSNGIFLSNWLVIENFFNTKWVYTATGLQHKN